MARIQDKAVDFLRSKLTDPNSVNRTGGANWIYPDYPRIQDLDKNSYPRIGVKAITHTGSIVGAGSTDLIEECVLQIFILSHENLKVTISSIVYQGDNLAEYLAGQVKKAFRNNWLTDANLADLVHNFGIRTFLLMPYEYTDEGKSIHRFLVEVEMAGFNLSE